MTPPRGLLAFLLLPVACVPPGNSTPSDAGSTATREVPATPAFRPSVNIMTAPYESSFDRDGAAAATPAPVQEHRSEAGEGEAAASSASSLGPDWVQAGTDVWHIENGRLCGSNAHNHGVWLQRTLPVNARIEFDAISDSEAGDLKAEIWGDGRSAATGRSYTNATSYLTILGGWNNTLHKIARLNEHGTDAKEIKVDKNKTSDDPREQPVTAGQVYHFKIERTDGKTVKWSVNGLEYLTYPDAQPLAGMGHDHFGFNDWEAKVCFDNVKVTPLP
ncbi:MAG: hypothetical protein ACLQVI_41240 [Polyangiaceae bacterium]